MRWGDSCLAEELPSSSGGQSTAPGLAPCCGCRAQSPVPEAPGHPPPLRKMRREGWASPVQAGLPAGAGAARHPPHRGLPGAAQRAPCHSWSPPAPVPGQRPHSAAELRARAAPSCCCCCCCSLLLQSKREPEAINGDCQASGPRACSACRPVLSSAAGRAGSQQLQPWLRFSGWEAPESRRATRAAAEASCPPRARAGSRCPVGVLAHPGDVLPRAAQPAR